MPIADTINNDIKKAMLARAEAELRALRAIKAALLLEATKEAGAGSVSDESAIKILQKLAKQRKESMEIFKAQGRNDLYDKENEELSVMEKYLPAQMDESQLKQILLQLISTSGFTSAADFSKLMPLAMKELAGKADGKAISGLLKELLNK